MNLAQIASIKTRSDLVKGQAVFDYDIVDVERLEYQGVSVPPDHGVLVVFSKGWRKGLYFDFEPLPPMEKERVEDLWISLGRCYGYLLFQEFHAISEQAWAALFAAKWFPFVGLKPTTIKEMIGWVNSAQSADEVLPTAAEEVRARLPSSCGQHMPYFLTIKQYSTPLLTGLRREIGLPRIRFSIHELKAY